MSGAVLSRGGGGLEGQRCARGALIPPFFSIWELPLEGTAGTWSYCSLLMHEKNKGPGKVLGLCPAGVPACSPPSPTLTFLTSCPWLSQDVADFEWVMWFTSFRNVIIFALSGHVLFAKLCTMVAPQVS